MSERLLNVAAIQQSCTADRQTNLAHSITAIRQAAEQGAQLVLLQELHTSLYFCQTEETGHFELAETIPGPSTEQLAMVARELGIVIVGSLFERRAAGLYHNTAVVFEANGELVGQYRKMHIPDDPGYYEKFYFTPGDLGFTPIQTSVGKLGVLVCWDQWFPEAARLMALAGAELLLYPTAIGWDPADDAQEQQRQLDAWQTIQRAHAIANGLPVIVSNRCGHEADASGNSQGIDFWGHSFIVGPQGEWLAQQQNQPGIISAGIDLQRSEQIRRLWPYLRDRRIDAYGDLMLRFRDNH